MAENLGFAFDGPLTEEPASQIPARPRVARDELKQKLKAALGGLPDDIVLDDPLIAAGMHPLSITAADRSVVLEVLFGDGGPVVFQAYKDETGKRRFKRLVEMAPCPGYERECGVPTRGGALCVRCSDMEREDLWNQP